LTARVVKPPVDLGELAPEKLGELLIFG
jgi:hypothetical protein